MNNMLLLIVSGLTGILTCAMYFSHQFKKLKNEHDRLVAFVDKLESDFLNEFAQLDTNDLSETKAGKELVSLLYDSEIYLLQAVQRDPQNIRFLFELANIYKKNEQWEKALLALKRAEELSPSSGQAGYQLGNFYKEINDIDNAILAYKRAQSFALAHHSLGKIHLDRLEYEEALDEFREAVKLDNSFSEAWALIAWTISEIENQALLSEADASARRSIQLEKDASRLWHRYAIYSKILYMRGKYEAALQNAEKAIKLAPDKAQAYYYHALIELKLGRFNEAQESKEKALRLGQEEWRLKAEALPIRGESNHQE